MDEQLIIATLNPGKIQEMLPYLDDLPLEIWSLSDLGITEQAPELTGTIEGNSEAKVRDAFSRTAKTCLAEDSGIEFDAFSGKPGVDTREWIGDNYDPEKFEQHLIEQFTGVTNLHATFRSTISVIRSGMPEVVQQESGIVPGTIVLTGRGETVNGLPFCRHFIPDGQEKTIAEMGPEESEKYNHRIIALRKACAFLDKHLGNL
ncbi:MAG TPA: non-canonical purine NTP pyrophosphatase [Candidatus Paceibacterota bacterium]|nr:non-canonical purine NTP pyrophosphatase [Candidatus Paceibacterota bacterium]